jgi:hypothetical protein
MKIKDVKIGGRYVAKISGQLVTVRILNETTITRFATDRYSGQNVPIDRPAFTVRNERTGRELVMSAARIRYEVAEKMYPTRPGAPS